MNRLCYLALMIFVITANVYADRTTPNGTVLEVIQALKREKSYSAVLDFIHWPTAFNNLKKEEKKELGINTPVELKAYLDSAVKNPKKVFTDLIEKKSKNLSAEQKASMQKVLKEQLKRVEEEQLMLSAKITETKFSISKTETKNNLATVYLKAASKNITETKPLNLVASQGIWYLTTTNFNQ